MNRSPIWIVAESVSEEVKQQFPDIHPVILQSLWNRGLRTQQEMDVYLTPKWNRDTHEPALFSRMKEAVARVFEVFEAGEIITIHGDYDADGVSGSALLITTLRELCRLLGHDEKKITYYIPHREKEGYGVSVSTVEQLHSERNTKLLITVDCGISNKPALDRGHELGMDAIVCDHHTMPTELPTHAILIHPLVPGETFPNKHLCGTGVAFKLASALYDEARRRGALVPDGAEKWLLDLVAIATVTDVMPLMGENRVLETFGLVVLNKTRRVGLRKLIEVAGGVFGKLDTTSIGFQIGPRLNSAGRMKHAQEALELLIEENELKAIELAQRLQETNQERQKLSQKIFLDARAQALQQERKKLLVVVGDWPAGLVGLVAGKLVNEFCVPTYVIGKSGDLSVGSGRTVGTFDVTKGLHFASVHLEKFGGHPQACGFSIRGEENLQNAIAALYAFAEVNVDILQLVPQLTIDRYVTLEELDWALFEALEQCRPFGQGNQESLFCVRDLTLVSFSSVGSEGKHLRLTVRSHQGKIMGAIAFGFGERVSSLSLSGKIDLVFHLRVNEWNGNRTLQLFVIDVQGRQ